MRTYKHVVEKFNSLSKPPRSKKYNEFQRPLRRVGESHLMMQKDPNSYVYVISGECAVRYLNPESPDKYQIAVRGVADTYNHEHVRKYTGLYNGVLMSTTDGTDVRVPLNHRFYEQGKDFSAVLTFRTSDNLLILSESWHADIYTHRSTDEDKDKRKKLKASLEAYITLQQFKLPTLKQNATMTMRVGRPFGDSWTANNAYAKMFIFLQQDTLPLDNPEFATTFDEVSQDCFNTLASKIVYKVNPDALRTGWRSDPSADADRRERAQDIASEITPAQFKESLTNALLKIANLGEGSASVALPQFPNRLPSRYFLISKPRKEV